MNHPRHNHQQPAPDATAAGQSESEGIARPLDVRLIRAALTAFYACQRLTPGGPSIEPGRNGRPGGYLRGIIEPERYENERRHRQTDGG